MVFAIGRCASLTSLLLVLSAMSTLVHSQAPGDAADQSCTKPTVPDGVFRLLDTVWYATLLTGDHNPAGWTQTPSGSFVEKGSFCTRRLESSCDVSDAWVVTQYINKSAVIDYAVNITVAVEGDSSISGDIKVHYFPSDGVITNNAQLNAASYEFIKSLSYSPSSEEKSVYFSLGSQYDRFYIAVEVNNTCFKLRGLKVSYNVCSRDPEGLVVYPDTPVGNSATTTSARCKDNAIVSSGSSLSITCNTDGTYSGSPSCSCDGGHFEFGDNCHPCAANFIAVAGAGSCTPCPPNTHSQVGSSECECDADFYKVQDEFHKCLPCPDNSNSLAGSTECTCEDNHYRTDGEGLSDPCTTAPGKPTGLTNSSLTNTSVTLSWTAPSSDGGRDDLFYTVQYNVLGDPMKKIIAGIKTNTVTVSGLAPTTKYVFVVVAGNNVTEAFSAMFPEVDRTSDELIVMTPPPCAAGFYAIPGSGTCEKCPVNTISESGASNCTCPFNYYLVSLNNCQPCPSNSITDVIGADECSCVTDYYRTSSEGPSDPCTREPTKPLYPTAKPNGTRVTLSWEHPASNGGRGDTFYLIKYKTSQEEQFTYYSPTPPVTGTSATVTSLVPLTIYTFMVVAENGVTQEYTDLFPEEDRTSSPIIVVTNTDEPTCSNMTTSSTAAFSTPKPTCSNMTTSSTAASSTALVTSVFVSGFVSSAITAVIAIIVCLVILKRRMPKDSITTATSPDPVYDYITESIQQKEMVELTSNIAYESVKN